MFVIQTPTFTDTGPLSLGRVVQALNPRIGVSTNVENNLMVKLIFESEIGFLLEFGRYSSELS